MSDRKRILFEELMVTEDKKLVKWVCDYQQQSALNKALRHVKPTKVLAIIRQEYLDLLKKREENPNDRTLSINYVESVSLLMFNKKDEITTKEVKFYGNHSYDNGVYVFDNEKDCIKCYNDLIWEHLKEIEAEKIRKMQTFDNQIKNLQEMFIGTDVVLETLSREK